MAKRKATVVEIPLEPSKTNEQLEAEARRPAIGSSKGPYQLKGLKTFPGMEDIAFDATLLRDGKPVGRVHNDGNGGMTFVDWDDRRQGLSKEEDLFKAFIEEERAKIPADRKTSWGASEKELFCSEILLSNLVNTMLLEKRWKRSAKTHTLFQIDGEIGTGEWKQIKGIGPDVRAHIMKKYDGKRIRIINDEFGG